MSDKITENDKKNDDVISKYRRYAYILSAIWLIFMLFSSWGVYFFSEKTKKELKDSLQFYKEQNEILRKQNEILKDENNAVHGDAFNFIDKRHF